MKTLMFRTSLNNAACPFYAQQELPGLRFAVTQRWSTESPPAVDSSTAADYAGFNLATHVGDDADRVAAHRTRLAADFAVAPAKLLFMDQVHGNRVAVIGDQIPPAPESADALVTTRSDVALAVLVADCVPVVIADEQQAAVAVVHAGRAGVVTDIIGATVAALRALGARQLRAWVGPSICARCYPVPKELCDQVSVALPVTQSVSWSGEPALDLSAGVLRQLSQAGVAAQQLPGCTAERPELFSYRRDRTTGRFAMVAQLRAGAAA